MDKNSREIILNILLDIENDHTFSNHALNKALRANQFLSKTERAFITRITEGVTEWKIRLDYIINQFSKTKMDKCRPVIRTILRMGCYEIFYMDSIPEEASCNEYVKLAGKRGFGSLKGFVNGVLRNICRNKNNIEFPLETENFVEYLSIKYSVPEEVISLLLSDYDADRLERIFQAGDVDRGTCIRVNTDRISVDDFTLLLKEKGIEVKNGNYLDTSLYISNYDYIRRVPGFFEGYFMVQDESASIAVLAADIIPGETIVDVCAAPGGKTLYAASLTGNSGKVIARDISDEKIALIDENIERLSVTNVKTQVHDALELDENLIGQVDLVIADLPCSGLGIMGRKNDIKYNVTKEKTRSLANLQKDILHIVSQYVGPGGRMIYSTCTIDSVENEENVRWFLQNSDFELESLEAYLPNTLKERGKKGYLTLVQGEDACDGFFISRFVRKSNRMNEK